MQPHTHAESVGQSNSVPNSREVVVVMKWFCVCVAETITGPQVEKERKLLFSTVWVGGAAKVQYILFATDDKHNFCLPEWEYRVDL